MAINTETLNFLQENIKLVLDLPPREKDVLRLRYGLDDNRERTLQEVGELFGVNRERIRQIEAKALRRLRGYVKLEKENPRHLDDIRKYKQTDVRAWNALRRSENPFEPYTIEQLSDKTFLSKIKNLGAKLVDEIAKTPDLYLKQHD